MTITLNGRNLETSCVTIGELLQSIDLAGRPVVVEHNKRALLPREHADTAVAEGDVLEVVQITAGG